MSFETLETLAIQLEQLRQQSQTANPNAAVLQQDFLMIQQLFQTQVLPLADSLAVPEMVQPILTEMNRTFRLLGTDIAFMQAARKSLTLQHRQRQMGDKLDQLIAFVDALSKALVV